MEGRESSEDNERLPVIHSLETRVPTSIYDDDVISPQKLIRRYRMIRVLGAGTYGWTIEALDITTRARYALKISLGEYEREAHEVAVLMNDMREETPVFVHTFGWYAISEVPRQWLDRFAMAKVKEPAAIGEMEHSDAFACTLMQLGTFTADYDGVEFTHQELKKIVWLLLHGLWVAKDRIGFEHQDLHEKNILFTVVDEADPIHMIWQSRQRTVSGLMYLPQIIDFDLANFGKDDRSQLEYGKRRDVVYLRNFLVVKRVQRLSDAESDAWEALVTSELWKAAEEANIRDARPLANLLEHPFFQDALDPPRGHGGYIRHGIQETRTPYSRCRYCPRLARFFVSNQGHVPVCSEMCADQWHSLTQPMKTSEI